MEDKVFTPLGKIIEEKRNKESHRTEFGAAAENYHQEFCNSVNEAAENGLKEYDKNFVIYVKLRRDVMFPEIIKFHAQPRLTLPYPYYDQIVLLYHRNTDTVKYLWEIPNASACYLLKQPGGNKTEQEQALLPQIYAFENGDLNKVVDDYNAKIEKERNE